MATLSGSSKKFFLATYLLLPVVLMLPNSRALAQETQYSQEEYSAYQGITTENDAAKKMELVLQFFKSWPKSTLKEHIVYDVQGTLKSLQDAKKWSQIITVGRQFLTVVPDDAYTITLVAAAYQETKNYQQFIIFGEEAYKKNPNGNIAYGMAKAYKSMGNNIKLVEWAEKTVAKLPDNFEMLFELASAYSDSERFAEADKYARQCLKVVQAASKPAGVDDKAWADSTRGIQMVCYYILGHGAYKRQDFVNAIPNFENALKLNLRTDMAFYELAMAYWQTQKIDMALKNFAKASLLGGTAAAPAKQQLEQLYKQTHRNSLTGIDKVIEAAKAELKK